VDRTGGAAKLFQGPEDIRVESDSDRMYWYSSDAVTIDDPAAERSIRIGQGLFRRNNRVEPMDRKVQGHARLRG